MVSVSYYRKILACETEDGKFMDFHLFRNMKSGHNKLARQMTLLMAFCDYVGNAIKVPQYF